MYLCFMFEIGNTYMTDNKSYVERESSAAAAFRPSRFLSLKYSTSVALSMSKLPLCLSFLLSIVLHAQYASIAYNLAGFGPTFMRTLYFTNYYFFIRYMYSDLISLPILLENPL